MTAPAAALRPAAAPSAHTFALHGLDPRITLIEAAPSPHAALAASELSVAWIHDDAVTGCPRCAEALGMVTT